MPNTGSLLVIVQVFVAQRKAVNPLREHLRNRMFHQRLTPAVEKTLREARPGSAVKRPKLEIEGFPSRMDAALDARETSRSAYEKHEKAGRIFPPSTPQSGRQLLATRNHFGSLTPASTADMVRLRK
jgi:hypothetical protein